MPQREKSKKNPNDDRSIVKTLSKGLELLDIVATAKTPLSLTEICSVFDADPGSIHRMLNTLHKRHYIFQDPSTKRYTLDVKVVQLSRNYMNQYHVYERSRPAVMALAEESGETVQVSIVSSQRCAVLVDEFVGQEMVSVSGSLGMRLPFHCTAHGKALLAFQPKDIRERLLASMTLEKCAPNTITSLARLEQELDDICRQGYATEEEEFIEGARAMAAPILDYSERPVATLGVIGPAWRFTHRCVEALASSLVEKCQDSSRQMGYIFEEESGGEETQHQGE